MSSRVRSNRYSRSRSRSPRYSRRHSRTHSRSRSRTPQRRSNRRTHSRSPMSNRRRHIGNREAPTESTCIGVFGLSLYTTERELEKEFSRFGPIEKISVVLDGKTGRSRGFGFVYYQSVDDARAAKNEMCGKEIDGRRIRVDFSITKRAHTPTPGVYMGRPTYTRNDRDYGDRYKDDDRDGYRGRDRDRDRDYYRRRSPSPYYRRSRRSRSRSYSPRRY